MKKSRQPRKQRSSRRMQPHLEFLEDRLAPTVSILESFEGGTLNNYRSVLHYLPAVAVHTAAAHDGDPGLGLVKNDGYEWIMSRPASEVPSPIRVQSGQIISVWIKFANLADGRAYFGFASSPQALTGQDSSSSTTLALVLAPNSNQLMFQNVSSGTHSLLGTATIANYEANHWYRAEITWSGTALSGRLYDSDGVTLLTPTPATATTTRTQSGIAFRAFGSPKYFDTVAVGDLTDTPQDFANASTGLPTGHQPGTPPAPLANNPITENFNQLPTAYTNAIGTGRDIQHNDISDGPVVVSGTSGAIGPDGRPWVALAGGNTSLNVGTRSVDWGPNYGGPATPLIAQWMLRQRPGEQTQVIGYAADVKHFFAPSVLDPGSPDTYSSGLNASQTNMTPVSELDLVTGRLHRPTHVRSMNPDGVNNVTVTHTHGPLDHRLRVPIADLDPAQNPAGTRWFYMAMIYVEGDQNIDNNSRWVEVLPSVSGTSVSLTNTGAEQLNFRFIPGLAAGPRVISQTPTGTVAGPLTSIRVRFDRPMNAATFAPEDVTVTAPGGSVTPTAVNLVSGTTDQFDIILPSQGAAGIYNFSVGPNIEDTLGNTMDQDVDGIRGEAVDDRYAGTFRLSAPRVLSHTPTGTVAGMISSIRVTFDRPMDAATFTTADIVTFTGPGGSITATGVTAVSGSTTQFDITFPGQVAAGNYTLTFGPDVRDVGGNLMDQNNNQVPGEVPGDRYTATFTIIAPRIISQNPTGTTPAPVANLRLTFNGAINPTTFELGDIVSFNGPNGPINVNSITPVAGSTTQFDLAFDPQDTDGVYTMILGPDIRDTAGNPMDQDGDGIPGEVPGDRYTATFTLGFLASDSYGYVASSVPFENINLVAGDPGVTTVTFPASQDDDSVTIPLGSNTFTFYGTTFTGSGALFVSTNGQITFGTANSTYSNDGLGDTSPLSQRAIAPLWDDWILTGSGNPGRVLYQFQDLNGDSTPDRLIIEWDQIYSYGSARTDPATYQVILNINTGSGPGAIVFNYVDLDVANPSYNNGASASVGIKDVNPPGTRRILISQNSGTNPNVQSNRALRFTAAGVFQFRDATLSVNESTGLATVTVRRGAGSLGAVSVQYATSDGTALAGQDYTAVSGTLDFTAGQTTATFTVPITDDAAFEPNETFNLMISNPTNGAILGTPNTSTVTITDNDSSPVLRVTSITQTLTGFIANFNLAFDPTVLSIYDGTNGTWGPADITLVGTTTGPVRGSVVIDSSNTRFTFIATGGLLPVDNYTITFRSDTNAFKMLSGGALLDGDYDGTPGGHYVGNISVTPSTAAIINVPDVSRGAGQVVNVPASGTGLPLRLSNATNVTTASFTLRYDPNLLRITGGTAVPAGASATVDTTTPGTALITFTSPVGINAGPTELVELVRLTADVPTTAHYRAKAVLDLQNVMVNGAVALDDDGLDLAAYLGDISGNGNLNSTDATFAQRIGVGMGTGADRYPLTDIVVLADANQDGRFSSIDAAHILRAAVGAASSIPPTPTPPVQLMQAGVDPLLIIGKRFRGQPNGTVAVPVVLDFSEGLESIDLAISYDTSRLEVVSVVRGSLTEDFDLFLPNVDPVAGTIRVGAGRTIGGLEGAGAGSLALITFRIKADAPVGRAIINLRRDVGSTLTQLNDGDYDLVPAPSNEAGDFLDGYIDVLDGRRETLKASEGGFDLFDLAGRRKTRGTP